MKFKNLPENIKKTSEQKAIEAFKAGWYMDAAETIISDMTTEEFVSFCLTKLKTSKFRIFSMAITNVEVAFKEFYATKNYRVLEKTQETFTRSSQSTIDRVLYSLLNIRDIKYTDKRDVAYICMDIYETGMDLDADTAIKQAVVDLIVFKYNNTNFGVLYGTT